MNEPCIQMKFGALISICVTMVVVTFIICGFNYLKIGAVNATAVEMKANTEQNTIELGERMTKGEK